MFIQNSDFFTFCPRLSVKVGFSKHTSPSPMTILCDLQRWSSLLKSGTQTVRRSGVGPPPVVPTMFYLAARPYLAALCMLMKAIEGVRKASEDEGLLDWVAWFSLSISVVIQTSEQQLYFNLALPSPSSGQEWWCVHLDSARARRGQVWLRETRGALAAHPHCGDHND